MGAAIIAVGLRQNTLIEVEVVQTHVPGVGQTTCWECGGDGDVGKFYGDLISDPTCVDCKGTGLRLVSI